MAFLTVLLAEDEPIICWQIWHLLVENDLNVVHATAPLSIIEACERFRPVWAILNLQQPDHSDGMALATLLQQHFSIPILWVTGASPQDFPGTHSPEAGFDILYKPFTHSQLRRYVRQRATWLRLP